MKLLVHILKKTVLFFLILFFSLIFCLLSGIPLFQALSFPKMVIQPTSVISKSKGLCETVQDNCTSTYQICGTKENNIIRTTTFNRMNL